MTSIPWIEFTGAALGAVFGPLFPTLISRVTRRGASLNTRREALESEICEAIDLIEKHSMSFWSMDANLLGNEGMKLGVQIVARLHHLNGLVFDLFNDDDALLRQCQTEFSVASDLITGRNFDDPGREADARMLAASCAQLLILRRGVKSRRLQLHQPWLS